MKETLLTILEYARNQIENSNHEILEEVTIEDLNALEEFANEIE